MIVYVILASIQNVIYRMDSWTKNPFIAKKYFKQFERYHPGAILREYECNSHLDLIRKVSFDSDVPIAEFPDLELITQTSYDSRLIIIYKSLYESSINNVEISSTIIRHYNEILSRNIKLYEYVNMDINMLDIQNAQIDIVYAWRTIMVLHMKRPQLPIVVFIQE